MEYDIKQIDRQRQDRWERNENRFARLETTVENLVWWHRGVSGAVIVQLIGFAGFLWTRMRDRNNKSETKR